MNLSNKSFKVIGLILVLTIFNSNKIIAQNDHKDFFLNAQMFFEKNVNDGLVDYHSVRGDPDELNNLLIHLDKYGTLQINSNVEKALLINAYNLFVIKGIADDFPTESPLKISGFFDKKKFFLAGNKVSLDQLEKEILIKQTQDPRLHFVLVCAAIGCPKLAEFAYMPNDLDSVLNQRTRWILNDLYFTRVNIKKKQVKLSQIFDWYEEDFTRGGKSVIEFVNQFRSDPVPHNYEVSYYEYDWNLNLNKK